MLTPRELGERLALARERLGLSQKELAERAGVTQSTIGNIEAGLRKRPRELLRIARAAACSPTWLETGRGSMEDDTPPPEWPFQMVPRELWDALSERQRGAVETAVLEAIQSIRRRQDDERKGRAQATDAVIAGEDQSDPDDLGAAFRLLPDGPNKRLLHSMLLQAIQDPDTHIAMTRRLLPVPPATPPGPAAAPTSERETPASPTAQPGASLRKRRV